MRNRIDIRERGRVVACVLMLVLLDACGSGNADATPTMSVDAIFTAAFQTFEAQQATQLALTPPTSTASPSPFPTLPPPSPIGTITFGTPIATIGGGVSCDSAAFVADVTIPDGTVMTPGQKFEKKWKLQNNGTCTWSTSYKIAFASGEQMGGATSFVTAAVPPGGQADLAVQMTAPTANGDYTGTWRMQNASGAFFGIFPTVVIKVGAGGTATAGPSPTGGPSPTSSGTMLELSGNAGVGGATVDCIGAGNKPDDQDTADDSGNYVCLVPVHWRGDIVPSKNNWNFDPDLINVPDDLLDDLSGQDFTAAHD